MLRQPQLISLASWNAARLRRDCNEPLAPQLILHTNEALARSGERMHIHEPQTTSL